MAFERPAPGSAWTPAFPNGQILTQDFSFPTGVITQQADEECVVPTSKLMQLNYEPVKPGDVEIWTGKALSGSQHTTITTGTPASGEVLVYPNGYLEFHADEASTTVYATYSYWGSIIGERLLSEIIETLRVLQKNYGAGSSVGVGRVNNTTLAVGDLVYPVGKDTGTGLWNYEKATPPAPAMGICLGAKTEGQEVGVLTVGVVDGLSEAFAIGDEIYQSTAARPTTETLGSVSEPRQFIGTALGSGIGFFNFTTQPSIGTTN